MSWSLLLPSRRSTGAPSCSPTCLWVSMSTIPFTVMSAPWKAPWGSHWVGARRSLITLARHRTRMWLSLQEPHQHSLPRLGHCWSSTNTTGMSMLGGWIWRDWSFPPWWNFVATQVEKNKVRLHISLIGKYLPQIVLDMVDSLFWCVKLRRDEVAWG